MAMEASDKKDLPDLAIICVLGAPGAGKGTLCTHLAQKYNLFHYSLGDNLRKWPIDNPDTPLAIRIRTIFQDQSSLTFEEIRPFLEKALESAKGKTEPNYKGILFDGYPRYMDQVKPFEAWLEKNTATEPGSQNSATRRHKPDVVLFFSVSKQNALERYLARARELTDNEEKFEQRFAKFEGENLKVIGEYRERGILISIDVNGTAQDSLKKLAIALEASPVWQAVVKNSSA